MMRVKRTEMPQILASELRFALDLSEEDAVKRLDRALPKVEVDELEE